MKKDSKKIAEYLKSAQSKKPNQSKNSLSKEVAAEFGVGLSTAKRWITDFEKEKKTDLELVPSINGRREKTEEEKEELEDLADAHDMTDEQIYDEIKTRLLRISRTAPWEKDVIAASKELMRLMASPEYKKAKEKKKEKPSMKEVGLVMSSIMLGVNPETIEEFKKLKAAANE